MTCAAVVTSAREKRFETPLFFVEVPSFRKRRHRRRCGGLGFITLVGTPPGGVIDIIHRVMAIGAACVYASRRVPVSGAAPWRGVARRPGKMCHRETPFVKCRGSTRFVRWCSIPTGSDSNSGRSSSIRASLDTPNVSTDNSTENDPSPYPKVLVIAGPTAVGKTSLSLRMAQRLNGEVVSADSVQVFRGLDVGSSKLPVEQRKGIKHHLLDIADPSQDVGAGEFVDKAWRCVSDIAERGKTPIVVGGTGMYLRWLIEGKPNVPPSDPETAKKAKEILRAVVEEAEDGLNASESNAKQNTYSKKSSQLKSQSNPDWSAAMRYLQNAGDKTCATRLAQNDWYRAERALAVVLATGKSVTEFSPEKIPPFQFTCVVLSSSRIPLYRRVDVRVEEMVRDGILGEACDMLLSGLTPGSTPATRSIGYRQAMDFLLERVEVANSENDEDTILCSHSSFIAFIETTQKATRAFAKRQFTWFRGEKEGRYAWLDVSSVSQEELGGVVEGLFLDDGGLNDEGNNNINNPAFDQTRGEADHATSQELKRYVPKQVIFVDEHASFETRKAVDALVRKIRDAREEDSASNTV